MFRKTVFTIFTVSILAGAGLAVAVLAASTAVAEPRQIGGSKVWGAFEDGKGRNRTCFVHGVPQKSRGKYKSRGEIYIQIAHRPAEKVRDEVSVTAGYRYKNDSGVDVDVDGRKFAMFTNGGNAWVKNAKDDRKLVRALIKGNRMIVRGRSTRNTLTVDTYTLKGFSAAYRSASRACKVPTS